MTQNASRKAPEKALEVSCGSSESNLAPINYLYPPPEKQLPQMPTLPVRSLGYPVSNQNRGRNADRPKAPATRESCFEFWSWGAEAEGGKARRARQGPGRVQCDTFLELRGRDIPFLKQPTIRFVQRSTGGGNATKQNSLNSLLYPGQRQNIKSAGLLLEISVE